MKKRVGQIVNRLIENNKKILNKTVEVRTGEFTWLPYGKDRFSMKGIYDCMGVLVLAESSQTTSKKIALSHFNTYNEESEDSLKAGLADVKNLRKKGYSTQIKIFSRGLENHSASGSEGYIRATSSLRAINEIIEKEDVANHIEKGFLYKDSIIHDDGRVTRHPVSIPLWIEKCFIEGKPTKLRS